jgi:hypothetical protein
MIRYLTCGVLGGLLAGCAPQPGTSGNVSGVPGYAYHDGVHDNYVSPGASPPAIENATRGVYLWPPMDRGRRS